MFLKAVTLIEGGGALRALEGLPPAMPLPMPPQLALRAEGGVAVGAGEGFLSPVDLAVLVEVGLGHEGPGALVTEEPFLSRLDLSPSLLWGTARRLAASAFAAV